MVALSEQMRSLRLPTSKAGGSFEGAKGIDALAARFWVELPETENLQPSQRSELAKAWMAEYAGAARFVVGKLWGPQEVVSTREVMAQAAEAVAAFRQAAPTLVASMPAQVIATVSQWNQGNLQQGVRLTLGAVRALITYGFLQAEVGSEVHGDALMDRLLATGQVSYEWLERDYVLRIGLFQAIVAIARTGLLDQLAADAEGSAAPAQGELVTATTVTILVAIFIIACLAALAYIVVQVYWTFKHNETLQKLLEIACEKRDATCDSVLAKAGLELARQPPPSNPLDQMILYLVLAGVGVGAMALLPGILGKR